ncbi:5-oxoprolinase subunit B family protein [Gryllotalpicola protaetiae]|uniref:Allophanate hydrolase subunit 1 n=1 Tax=Gryllotalpicola protaetiae TaxID=2419771 RepID=A0A387BPK6_9MICO|nr:allophanate hydrolase subunit 1 [Gryllotalpicola protaetiae]AYG02947.1 allophanate hydrolase subunit 1 [Gryllotalpicola protaetiae]
MTQRFLRAGERDVLVEFPTLADAVAARAALEGSPIPGVTDAASGARTLMLHFDQKVTNRAAVEAAVAALEPGAGLGVREAPPIEIPVVYDGEDLDDTAALLGITPDELIAAHTGRTWVCAFGGFAPGFAYLVSDGASLDVPRLAAPRTRVPAGAVGLAGEFSGVYPRESPGGWRLIGRTELPMWDLARTPPAAVPVGAAVRFTRVNAAEVGR